jgi:hypothetical protein
MGRVHVVKEGEHVPRIAAGYGIGDYAVVWNDPNNAELSQSRDPCVLRPGDQLFIPDVPPLEFQLPTGRSHRIVIKRPKVRLRLVLQDSSGRPLANVACQLKSERASFDLMLDGDGKLDQQIPVDSERCTLVLPDRELSLLVGHLTPNDDPAGWRARLNNLGYEAGSSDDEEDPQLRSAIEEFQCDNGLAVTGSCDASTQAKLLELHGS